MVSYVWRGHGSAIFLELGELKENNIKNHPSGESTISIEWSWRVENKSSIILGSWSDDEDIDKIKDIIKGLSIKNISFFSRLKEIEIQFNEDIWLSSFATAEGDPEWSIKNNNKWLFFKKGRFVSEEYT